MNEHLANALALFGVSIIGLLLLIVWEIGQFRKDYRNVNRLNQNDKL